MTNPISNKRILLGVTGSIACYKVADLASKLRQAGAEVDVVLTASARQFVTPLTFQSVTGKRAYTDDDMWGDAGHVLHVGLAEAADLLVIAPITANTMAKLAHGIADNLLTVAALAARCPILIAPAMDGGMWEHPATQENLRTLQSRGYKVVGPAAGHLASGLKGLGRMVEPGEILGEIRVVLAANGPLRGRRIVVTAGGTREPIDPVRAIANRSSGKQGFALAQAAADLGGTVTLITGETHLDAPAGVKRIQVGAAQEMFEAVLKEIKDADILVMAAAVADFTPAQKAKNKLKKGEGIPEIVLAATTDILAAIAQLPAGETTLRVRVGFAAETTSLIEHAKAKLQKKNLDMIVANDISAADAGFGVDTNRVHLLFADGRHEALPLMGKDEVALRVMAEIIKIWDQKMDQ